MLQRIQTLFLLGALLCMSLTFVFPVWTYDKWEVTLLTPSENSALPIDLIILAVVAGVACFGSFVSILMYKKRTLQMKLTALNIFFTSAFIGLLIYDIMAIESASSNIDLSKASYGISYFLPMAAILFNVLAYRFIRKDERLVRSIDRIR